MKIKKIATLICAILCLSCYGCGNSYEEYISESKGISLMYTDEYNLEEAEGYILLSGDNTKLEIIINAADVTNEVDESYKSRFDISQLDIQCGAFNSTYNNYIYAGNLFAYLLDGNGYSLTPTWIDKTTFGSENYFAYYSALEGENNCGYIYETVQNGKLYIICIYIDDYYDVIFDYSEEIEEIIKNITFLDEN